ncbi:MAG: hypothetical protein AAF387_08765, partial [Pseudomonadota bacterium]
MKQSSQQATSSEVKVRKYFAADMRSALEMVRTQQGSDVLILSNRQLDDGIELITADNSVDAAVLQSFQKKANALSRGKSRTTSVKPSVRKVGEELAKPNRAVGAEKPEHAANAKLLRSERLKRNQYIDNNASNGGGHSDLLWTDENTVRKMQQEMNTIKGLLEQQLSGLAWSNYGQKYPQRARVLRSLNRIGVAPELALSIVKKLPGKTNPENAWRQALSLLVKNIQTLPDPILSQGGGSVAVCGPTGVGKTTLVSKLAALHAKRHGVDSVSIL